jgi:hypothetical protein
VTVAANTTNEPPDTVAAPFEVSSISSRIPICASSDSGTPYACEMNITPIAMNSDVPSRLNA